MSKQEFSQYMQSQHVVQRAIGKNEHSVDVSECSKERSDIFTQMVNSWPSPVVSNSKVKDFSGGLIAGKTLQNYAAQGLPVPDSIRVARKRAWIATSLADWLRSRCEGRAVA